MRSPAGSHQTVQLVHIQEEVTVVIDLTIRRQDHPQIFRRRVVHRQLVLGYVAQMNGSVRTAEHGLLPAPQKVAVEGAVLDTQCANDGTVGLVADHGLPAARFFLQHHQHIVIGAAGVVVGHFGPQVHIHRGYIQMSGQSASGSLNFQYREPAHTPFRLRKCSIQNFSAMLLNSWL